MVNLVLGRDANASERNSNIVREYYLFFYTRKVIGLGIFSTTGSLGILCNFANLEYFRLYKVFWKQVKARK